MRAFKVVMSCIAFLLILGIMCFGVYTAYSYQQYISNRVTISQSEYSTKANLRIKLLFDDTDYPEFINDENSPVRTVAPLTTPAQDSFEVDFENLGTSLSTRWDNMPNFEFEREHPRIVMLIEIQNKYSDQPMTVNINGLANGSRISVTYALINNLVSRDMDMNYSGDSSSILKESNWAAGGFPPDTITPTTKNISTITVNPLRTTYVRVVYKLTSLAVGFNLTQNIQVILSGVTT